MQKLWHRKLRTICCRPIHFSNCGCRNGKGGRQCGTRNRSFDWVVDATSVCIQVPKCARLKCLAIFRSIKSFIRSMKWLSLHKADFQSFQAQPDGRHRPSKPERSLTIMRRLLSIVSMAHEWILSRYPWR